MLFGALTAAIVNVWCQKLARKIKHWELIASMQSDKHASIRRIKKQDWKWRRCIILMRLESFSLWNRNSNQKRGGQNPQPTPSICINICIPIWYLYIDNYNRGYNIDSYNRGIHIGYKIDGCHRGYYIDSENRIALHRYSWVDIQEWIVIQSWISLKVRSSGGPGGS